jgi:AcrR family transcriptional regulator
LRGRHRHVSTGRGIDRITVSRDHIVAAAKNLLLGAPTEPFSHERVAQAAGVGARTVYRHFPTRADLMQALWEKVRDETRTPFANTATEVVAICLAIYSAPFWMLLRDRGELTGEEPGDAAAWALSVLLKAAKTGTRKTSPQEGTDEWHRRTPGAER